MSITDELRTGGIYRFPSNVRTYTMEELTAIADRIDEEHEKGIVDALLNDGLPMSDEVMAEHGWIRLPVDADGEYIHIGDVMEWCDSGDTLEVVGIGDDCLFYLDGEEAEWTAARNKRHHHAPTVEDVLREFACVLMGKREFDGDVTGAVAEYAAKLRLAEKEDA